MAMLLCLDLEQRMAYVLGDILQLDHTLAGELLELDKATYRKRLSRARAQVVAFTQRACGLANPQARCSCPRRLPAAVGLGRVTEGRYAFALKDAPSYDEALARASRVEGELKVLSLQLAAPEFASPADLAKRIVDIVHTRPQETP